jgi:hypothetical protein
MCEPGYVSLWLGNASSQESLEDHTRLCYDGDCELIPSPFMREWHLDMSDEGFREAECLEQSTTALRRLLQGVSYEEQIISVFEALIGEQLANTANAFVLLYDFKYRPSSVQNAYSGAVGLHFVGVCRYHP